MSDFDLASAQPVQFDLASAKPVTPAATPSLTDQILRKIALGGRAAAEGVVGTLSLPDTIGTGMRNLMSRGVNAVFGSHLQTDEPSYAQNFSNALTSAGAYTPDTRGEQMGSAITRGVTGALTGGGILSAAGGVAPGIPTSVRLGASGATGAASSEGARQLGLPSWAQFGAGVIGGLVPSALEGAGNLAVNATRPLLKSGQRQIAGNVLASAAQDPQAAAANLDASAPIVPNSLPTSGPASLDTGILSLEKGLRGKNPAPFADRLSEQNAARQAEVSSMGGTPADIEALTDARNAQAGATREAAFDTGGTSNVRPVLLQIDRILASPAGKRDVVSQALNWLKDKLTVEDDTSQNFMTPSQVAKSTRGTFTPRDPENLYAIRQDINDAIAGKLAGDQSKFKLAQGQLLDIRNTLDDAIEEGAPGFKGYLKQYGQLSQPINQKTLIQELQEKASQTAYDPKTGQYFLSPAQYSNALDSALGEKLNPLTEQQTQRLENVRSDLQNSQLINGPLLKAPGSDTFQNLSRSAVLGGPGVGGPLGNVAMKPLGWLYKAAGTDEKINDLLTQAMLDPKLAAVFLRQGRPVTQSLLRRVGSGIVPYAQGGLLGSLAAQPGGTGSSP